MKKYGHIIYELRKKHGLTQEQLGKKLNVSYQAVSKWENNLSEPDLETFEKLTEIFGISISEFFEMTKNSGEVIETCSVNKGGKVNGSKVQEFIKNKPWYLVAVLSFVTFILALCAFLIPIGNYSSQSILNNAKPSVFNLKTYNDSGAEKTRSGFFINNRGLAVTTYSAIDGAVRGEITLNDTTYEVKSLVGIDETFDLALIQIDIKYSKPIAIGSGNSVKLADKVYTIGSKSDGDVSLSESLISKINYSDTGNYFQLLTTTIRDGSVLINLTGQVVGIFNNAFTGDVGMDTAIPINAIFNVKRDINLSLYDFEDQKTGYYYLSFDANGGSGDMPTQKVKCNKNIDINKVTFTHAEYVFAGWEYSGQIYSDEQSIYNLTEKDNEITLKATWAPYYTLIFSSNGASGEMSEQKVPINTNVKIKKNTFEKQYYVFDGWVVSGIIYNDQQTINNIATVGQTITLVANWSPKNYSITYKLDGGNNGDNITIYNYNSEEIILKDAKKEGFDFEGWFRESDFSGEKVTSIPSGSSGNITLWAKFTPISYAITYHLEDGESTTNPTSYTIKNGIIYLSDAVTTIDGFEFLGWYDGPRIDANKITQINCSSKKDYNLYGRFISNITIGNYRALYNVADMYYYFQSGNFDYANQNFILCNNIDIGYIDWVGIDYSGHFNGNGYTLSDPKLYKKTVSNVDKIGFFSRLENAFVENLTFSYGGYTKPTSISQNSEMVRASYLCAEATNSKIVNCKILNGLLNSIHGEGSFYMGSLIAYAENCLVDRCYSNCEVRLNNYGYNETYYSVGAMIGYIEGTENSNSKISNSYCDKEVYINPYYTSPGGKVVVDFSGFIGSTNYCEITNCYSSSPYTVKCLAYIKADNYGGLVGKASYTKLTNCFATGNFKEDWTDYYRKHSGGAWLVGKFIGSSNVSNMTNCYALTHLANTSKNYSSLMTNCEGQLTATQIYQKVSLLWDNEIWEFPENSAPVLKEEKDERNN